MPVLEDLLSSVSAGASPAPAQDVRVGLYWTAVHGPRLGLAATLSDRACCFAADVDGAGYLHRRTVNELALLLRDMHPLARSIGLAALNALIAATVDECSGSETNARDVLLERGRGKTVVTVGHFPFTDALRNVAARLWVLELDPGPGDHPAEAAPDLIPQADVIGLTASTLMNGTFDALSRLFPPDALVVMLGPSTPLSPVLFDHGVHMLGGALVDDPAAVLHFVGQGASLHRVPGLRRFTLLKR
ncbi:MAG: DUF364 domain-containing protein [Anaerolineae bacterium]|nr:DUF364 domain-containing protein [Anaerolineae bacterium]